MDCPSCGGPVVPARGGGARKRFCSHACRSRWHNGRRRAADTPGPFPADDERTETLRWLWGLLRADVENHGTLIPSGQGESLKANPSAALLVKVGADLDRRDAATARATPAAEESNDLAAVLRMVDTPG